MAHAFGRMNAYLESLPRGVHSYPDYAMKAATYREFLAEIPAGRSQELEAMPGPLMDAVQRPPPVNGWIPEVHATAVFLAIADAFFVSDELFLVRKLETNRRLLRSPLYRVLFLFTSPGALLRGAPARWLQFHRGIQARFTNLDAGHVNIRLDFPHGLVPPLMARAYACAFQAAIEASGGKLVRVNVTSSTSTYVNLDAEWR